MLYQLRHAVAKGVAYLLNGHVGVFDHVVQHSRCQHFGVAGDGCHNRGCLHRVNDVGEAFASPLGAAVGINSEACSLVEQGGF